MKSLRSMIALQNKDQALRYLWVSKVEHEFQFPVFKSSITMQIKLSKEEIGLSLIASSPLSDGITHVVQFLLHLVCKIRICLELHHHVLHALGSCIRLAHHAATAHRVHHAHAHRCVSSHHRRLSHAVAKASSSLTTTTAAKSSSKLRTGTIEAHLRLVAIAALRVGKTVLRAIPVHSRLVVLAPASTTTACVTVWVATTHASVAAEGSASASSVGETATGCAHI